MNRMNDVAVLGLGVMGSNLARNFASRGFKVAIFNRTTEVATRLNADHPEANFDVRTTLPELVASLERPRRIVVMVNAGAPVDAVLESLDPLLDPDDIVIDAGNSHFKDTDRRSKAYAARSWRFFGMGVSGGAEGALKGPAIMPGGDQRAWERLRPALEKIAAVGSAGPCVTYCGKGSAGHFVKMVHNGIEYGDMQLIAETAVLLRRGLGQSGREAQATFSRWNQGELASYLIEITADILGFEDPERPGSLLVDSILDSAGQKGTGRWTVAAALDLGVPIPTITSAVDARALSSDVDLRKRAQAALFVEGAGLRAQLSGVSVEDLRDALYASKLASYTQGFRMLRVASKEFDYGIELPEVARIWTGGCIIRATLLERMRRVLADPQGEPAHGTVVLAPEIAEDIRARVPAWRRVVTQATLQGYAIPGLSASLAWYDTLTTARGSAGLLQAQRDYFGSHTYERVDRPGTFHTEWKPGSGVS
jgi:6-phosphogluconate dehydrogenase